MRDIDFCEKAIKLAQDIVKIPSEAPPGEEKAVAEKLAEVLSEGGLETKLVEAAPGRPNVLATLRGWIKDQRCCIRATLTLSQSGMHPFGAFLLTEVLSATANFMAGVRRT